jgi:hypothetical protein
MDARRPLVALVACFALLAWQHEALRQAWPYVALGGALFLGTMGLALRARGRATLRELGALLLVAYLGHQFEEHGFDLLGRPYAFLAAANGVLGPVLGCAPNSACPLTVDAVYWVNTLLVWWPMSLAVVTGRRLMVLCSAGLTLTNAVAHVVSSVVERGYNPGLGTALTLFVPAGLFVVGRCLRAYGARWPELGFAVAWGALGHALLGGLAFAVYTQHLLPEPAYPLLLLGWATLPWVVARATGGGTATAERPH